MRPLTRCYTALIALALVLVAAHSRADPYCTAESNPEHCATLENQMRYLYYPRADNNFGRVDNLLALFYHRQLVAQGKAVVRRADMSLGDPEQDYQRGLLFLSLSPEDRAAVLSADTVAATLDRLVTPQAKATVAAEATFFRSLPSDAVRSAYMTSRARMALTTAATHLDSARPTLTPLAGLPKRGKALNFGTSTSRRPATYRAVTSFKNILRPAVRIMIVRH